MKTCSKKERKAKCDAAYYAANKERIAAAMATYRQTHKENAADYQRQYYQDNREYLLKQRHQHSKTERGRATIRNSLHNQRLRHPDRIQSRRAVSNALRAGQLVRQPCEICGSAPTDAHHDSYRPERQLDIRWLCHVCHVEHHNACRVIERLEGE